MPFITFDSSKTRDQYTYVKQNSNQCIIFSQEAKARPLVYTTGLNPCTGIILYGEIQLEDEEGEASTEKFVILNHNQGLEDKAQQALKSASSEEEQEKILSDFWVGQIGSMLGQIEEEAEELYSDSTIKQITLTHSFVIRCVQNEKLPGAESKTAQIANQTATALKSKLRARESFAGIASEYLDAPFSVAADYKMESKEVDEVEDESGDVNTLDCYLMSNAEGELDLMYYEDSPKLLKEQKVKARSEAKHAKKESAAELAALKEAKTKKSKKPDRGLAVSIESSPLSSDSLVPKQAAKNQAKPSAKKKHKSSSSVLSATPKKLE